MAPELLSSTERLYSADRLGNVELDALAVLVRASPGRPWRRNCRDRPPACTTGRLCSDRPARRCRCSRARPISTIEGTCPALAALVNNRAASRASLAAILPTSRIWPRRCIASVLSLAAAASAGAAPPPRPLPRRVPPAARWPGLHGADSPASAPLRYHRAALASSRSRRCRRRTACPGDTWRGHCRHRPSGAASAGNRRHRLQHATLRGRLRSWHQRHDPLAKLVQVHIGPAVHADDDIAEPEPGLLGRTAGRGAEEQHALAVREAERKSQWQLEWLNIDAEPPLLRVVRLTSCSLR